MKLFRKITYRPSLSLRPIASFIILSFIATQVLIPTPASFAQSINPKISGGDSVSVSTAQVLNGKTAVPPELGKIEESFQGTTNKTIFFIQDAHDSLEAQENIAKLIGKLVKEKGIKTVFEEGYEGPVPTDKFFGFIKDPEIKQKVSYFLLDKLRLGGAEYAHVNRKHDFKLIGVESLKLYAENIKAYQNSSKNRKEIEADLTELFAQISILANRHFPKELKSWLRSKERSSKGALPLLSYLKELRALYLKAVADPVRFPREYPALSSLLAAETMKNKKLIGQLNALDSKLFFEEINRLEKELSDTFLQNIRDKQIFDYYQSLSLLKQLNQIQLTQSEYDAAKEALQELDTRKLADFIVSLTRKSLLLSKEWERHIKDAVRFYNVAQSRDGSINECLTSFIKNKKEDTAALVFGGFHATAIKELLCQQGISYVVISPRITKIEKRHQDYYRELMSVGHYPFETPFLVAHANKPPSIYFSAKISSGEMAVRTELRTIASVVEAGNSDSQLIERRLTEFNQPRGFQDIHTAFGTSKTRSEIRSGSILSMLQAGLKKSARFTPAHSLLHARVLEMGVTRFARLRAKSLKAVINEPEIRALLMLAQRSYELASLYLAATIRDNAIGKSSSLENLLGSIHEQDYLSMPADEIAFLEYKSQSLANPIAKKSTFSWNNADALQLPTGGGKASDETLVIADSQVLNVLQVMVQNSIDPVNYIESQPALRLSDLPFGRPDIRWVQFGQRITLGKSFSFLSKKYSKTSTFKRNRALEEFRLTREIVTRIGERRLEVQGFKHPVVLSVPTPRVFLQTQDAAFLLSDFVPEAKTMNDFLLGLSRDERKPYLELIRSLLKFFISNNIYWAAPNLRNILISFSDVGQMRLSLVDFDKSEIGPMTEMKQKSMMLQFWRGAHGLEPDERSSVTRGYFSGPGMLDDSNEPWSESQTNFARMMAMDPVMNMGTVSEKNKNRYLKKRIELLEMENIESPDGGAPVPIAAIEHQLRLWYRQMGFSTRVFYDVLYSLYLKDEESGSKSRKEALLLLWKYFKLDWINEEARRLGFHESTTNRKTSDTPQSLVTDFTTTLWLADLLEIEKPFLEMMKNQSGEMSPWKALKEVLAATGPQLPLSLDFESWSSFMRQAAPALARKIRRFRTDIKTQADHPLIAEAGRKTIHIYYLGERNETYENAFQSQLDKLFDLLGRTQIPSRSEMRQGEGQPEIQLHWGGASSTSLFVLEHADGGQDLRNALAFSAILKRPIFLADIRPDSNPPGMRAAHMLPITVLGAMTNARIAPYSYQSRSLFFSPGEIRAGNYAADIQSIQPGSRSLSISGMQAILPAALFADGIITLDLHGGTALPGDISSTYLSYIFFPFIQRELGIQAQFDVFRNGWDGRGHIQLKMMPISHSLQSRTWTDRGDLKNIRVVLHKSKLETGEQGIIKKLRGKIQQDLSQRFQGIPITIEEKDISDKSFDGKALAIMLVAEYQKIPSGFSDLYLFDNNQSPKPETLWQNILDRFVEHDTSGAALDPNLADQVLAYLAVADGTSEFTVSEVTDHLLREERILNDLMNGHGFVEIQGEAGKPGRIFVKGMALEPDANWTATLKNYAEQYGFYGNTDLFLRWTDDWADLIGTSRLDVFSRLKANLRKHVFPRALFIPEEMEAYLLRVAKASKDTGMKPVFIERVAAPFARYYRSLSESLRTQMNIPLKDSRTIKLSRLEHSGIDKTAFLKQYPDLTFPTSILSPTLNTLLSSDERDVIISKEQKQKLRAVYENMDSTDRRALDHYLETIWGVADGFGGLLDSQMKRSVWIQYLADWRIDPRYLNYIYQQKKIQSWNGGVSGPDHETLLSLWNRVFEGQEKIQASKFVENLAHELGGELGATVYSKDLSIKEHIQNFADKNGDLHRYQDKVLFKIYRLLLAAAVDYKGMRHHLTHGARPFLNVLLHGTGFYQEASEGIIFVDEVANGGETTFYAELMGKSFIPDFKYQFFILAQTHPELGRMYEQQTLVDGVLSEKGIHAVEDFPELMEAFYSLNAKQAIFEGNGYQERLAAVRNGIALQGVDRLFGIRQERDRNIEKLLEDERLRVIIAALAMLESNRHSSPMKLPEELVKQFLRKRRGDIQPIDKYVIPNAFLSGITAFSNRDYPTIDRQWELIAEFEARLSELESVQQGSFRAIDEADRQVRLLDERDYLEHWLDVQSSLYSRIQRAHEELFRGKRLVEDYLLNGKLTHSEFVKQILSNGNYHRSEVRSENAKEKRDVEDFQTLARNFIASYSESLRQQTAPENLDRIVRAIRILEQVYRKRGRIFIAGNGESAALASHFVVDFAKGPVVAGRDRLSVIPLGELSWISALGNDVHYADVYTEQLENHSVGENDAFFVVRPNLGEDLSLNKAVALARRRGASIIYFGHPGLSVSPIPQKEVRLSFSGVDDGIAETGMLAFDHLMVDIFKRIVESGKKRVSDVQIEFWIRDYFTRELEYLQSLDVTLVQSWASTVQKTLQNNNRIFILGNGGHVPTSNYIASKLKRKMRQGTLTGGIVMPLTEQAEMTGLARDEGYADVFVKQLEPVLKSSDLIIAMSTSGNSENVIRALQLASERGSKAVGVYGFTRGRMETMGFPFVRIPDKQAEHSYGRTEDLMMLVFNLFLKDLLRRSEKVREERIKDEVRAKLKMLPSDTFKKRGVGTNPGVWVEISGKHYYIKKYWDTADRLGDYQLRMEWMAGAIYRKLGYRFPESHLVETIDGLYLAVEEIPGFQQSENLAQYQDDPEIRTGYVVDILVNNRNVAYWKNLALMNQKVVTRLDAGGGLLVTARGYYKELLADASTDIQTFRNHTTNESGAQLFLNITQADMRRGLTGDETHHGIGDLSDEEIRLLIQEAGIQDVPEDIARRLSAARDEAKNSGNVHDSEAVRVLTHMLTSGGLASYLFSKLKARRDWLLKYSVESFRMAQGFTNASGVPPHRSEMRSSNQQSSNFYEAHGADYFRARGTGSKNLAKENLYGTLFSHYLGKGASVLDVGAGFGHLVNEFSRRGFNATAVDISTDLLEEARARAKAQGISNVTYRQGNALDLPIPSNSQNAVTITNVVEHFSPEESRQFMAEARRVLKKDGYLLIGVPYRSIVSRLKLLWRRLTDPYVWKNWDKVIDDTGDLTHKIWFDDLKLKALFKENGFEMTGTDYFVYRTAEWPRGTWIHLVQQFLDKVDKEKIIKRNLAYGVYMLGRKTEEGDSRASSEVRIDVKSDMQKITLAAAIDKKQGDQMKRSELRSMAMPETLASLAHANRMVQSVLKGTQPATVFVDAEDFSSLSEAQKQEYLIVALSNKALRVVVYNERGQVQGKELDALLKLDRVERTDRDLGQAVVTFSKSNVPAIHLSKHVWPSQILIGSLRKRVAFFKANGNKSGTLATALLWAISGGKAAHFSGVKEEAGFWIVEEALLDSLQRTYDNNFVIAIAA